MHTIYMYDHMNIEHQNQKSNNNNNTMNLLWYNPRARDYLLKLSNRRYSDLRIK